MDRTLQIIVATVISVIAIGLLLKFLFGALYGQDTAGHVNASLNVSKERMAEQLQAGCSDAECAASDADTTDCKAPACIRDRCTQSAMPKPALTQCGVGAGRGRCDNAGTCVPIPYCTTQGAVECAGGQYRTCTQMLDLQWGGWAACPSGACSSPTTCSDNVAPVISSLAATPPSVRINNPVTIAVTATDDVGISEVKITIRKPDGTQEELPLTRIPGTNNYGVSYVPAADGTYAVTARVADATGNAATRSVTFTATQLKYQIAYVSLGFSDAAAANAAINRYHSYFVSKTPLQSACTDVNARIEKVVIPPSLCGDLSCTCHCSDCFQRMSECVTRYAAQTPGFSANLYLGITAQPADCSLQGMPGTLGCAANNGAPYASSDANGMDWLTAHEAGHAMGLCHELPCAPGYASQTSQDFAANGPCLMPAGIDMTNARGAACPNMNVPANDIHIMNYVQASNKRFSDSSLSYLRTSVFSEYMQGCSG